MILPTDPAGGILAQIPKKACPGHLIKSAFTRVFDALWVDPGLRKSMNQPASATHSISQPLPNRSCIDQTVRAGGSAGKNSR